MVTYKERKPRSFQDIKTLDDILDFLKTQFTNNIFTIKYSIEKREAKINEILEDKCVMVVTDADYEPNGNIILYGLLDKYFEIDLKVEEARGPGYYKCRIQSLRKAEKGRKYLRFKVSSDKVTATNFKISKHTIELNNFTIPTTIKVIIEQFQTQQQKLGDIVKVDLFQPGDAVLDYMRKTGKALYIEDTSKPESYKTINEDFIDLKELLGSDLEMQMKKNIEKGYKSLIQCPVIYITETEQSIPFAYIQVISKQQCFGLDKVIEIKGLCFTLVDRIRDANTMLIQAHQRIVDISVGGAKLMFTDENLKKYVSRTRGFVFDVVFKLQAPITIYGEIKHLYSDQDGNLFVGVDFAGNSSRKDEMKRFYSIMKPMEIDYKNRLMKERRDKKKSD